MNVTRNKLEHNKPLEWALGFIETKRLDLLDKTIRPMKATLFLNQCQITTF